MLVLNEECRKCSVFFSFPVFAKVCKCQVEGFESIGDNCLTDGKVALSDVGFDALFEVNKVSIPVAL